MTTEERLKETRETIVATLLRIIDDINQHRKEKNQ